MLLEVKNVSFECSGKVILKNISLSLDQGELIIIGGPSGGGKTTLLRLLNRLEDPTDGDILFNGKRLPEYRVVELRRQICLLQQTPLMIEGTVKQNLLVPFTFRSADAAAIVTDKELLELLTRFKLSDVSLNDDATRLSVGQKQRLAFIRALLIEPRVLLLDEPTSALDPISRMIVEEQIKELSSKHGIAIAMVTHFNFTLRTLDARRYVLDNAMLKELAS